MDRPELRDELTAVLARDDRSWEDEVRGLVVRNEADDVTFA